MTEMIQLRRICHARSGDKGDTVNIGLAVCDRAHYAWVRDHVTEEAVGAHLGDLAQGPVERYELPKLGALNFVVRKGLGGGVTRSLRIDGHGKGFGAILLEMRIEAPPECGRAQDESPPVPREPLPAVTKELDTGSCIRLGSGSAYENDRLDAPQELAESGQVDYLVFDCLSEKTNLEAVLRRMRGGPGYDLFLEAKLRAVLPGCIRNGTTIIANGGAADVEGAAQLTVKICRELNLPGVKVAYVLGDDVLDRIRALDPAVSETGLPASSFGDALMAAHAYQGAGPIVEGLRQGANVVLTGRAGDSAQFLAPMIHEYDWSPQDWDLMGKGLGVGHLLECAGQITGGYYADPGTKEVPDLHRIGFPIAEVSSNGDAIITKLPTTGGLVTERTCKEQLLYEIPDPSDYKHNDGVVDFTTTEFAEIGRDRVFVTGTTGHPRPPTTKVVLGVIEGYVGMGRVIYCGTGSYEKAQLAASVVAKRMSAPHGVRCSSLQFDFIGANSL